ncbi:MAG TPA: hypothetical protein VN449_11985 [Gaiellaceae bacterium]|nr:hypothetical protein [Gaiellaceae bacterium]
MSEGFAPRFAIEAAFLILLGVGAGYADLRTPVIVGLVAGGWVVVALIELSVWRSQTRHSAEFVPLLATVDEGPEAAYDDQPDMSALDDDYPLRAGAGDAVSEEIEAYTRILDGTEGEASAEPAAPPSLPPS